jgi:hypothetical protein
MIIKYQIKTHLLLLFCFLIGFSACNDEGSPNSINGEYTGVFERDGSSSAVELTFTNGVFTGESEIEKFPALCNGTYTISVAGLLGSGLAG